MKLWVILTELQSSNNKPFSNERERLNPKEGPRTYDRMHLQNSREDMSRMKGKAKGIFTESSTTSWSGPPAYQRASDFPPLTSTISGDAAHARALQAQVDKERASYDLARQLQAQEDSTLREHRMLVQESARFKAFDCAICMEKYPEDYSAPVRSCGHALCRACMKEHVQSQVDQAIWPIRCPLCVANKDTAGQRRTEQQGGEYELTPPLNCIEDSLTFVLLVITRDLVETLGIDEALLAKWVRLEMDLVSVAVECPG